MAAPGIFPVATSLSKNAVMRSSFSGDGAGASVARGAERDTQAARRGIAGRKGVFADHGKAIAHQMRQHVGAAEMFRQRHPEMVARRPRRIADAFEEAGRELLARDRLVADGADD